MAERASTLLTDVLSGLLNEFYSISVEAIGNHRNPEEITRRLDALQNAISTVKITGEVTQQQVDENKATRSGSIQGSINILPAVSIAASGKRDTSTQNAENRTVTRKGSEIVHLMFGSISGAISDLIAILGKSRVWFLVDEWSEVPVDLQPYLADLFRRTLLPINAITIKIAAIEHRTNFAIIRDRGEYIGLELGADVAADLNLDDFLVFDNSQEKSVDFIGSLIFRHYSTSSTEHPEFRDIDEFIGKLFTQRPVFEEFVRAVEGVPRDALNLIAKVVTKAFGQQIAMVHVRAGARDWYEQDKAAVIRNDPTLADLLQHIIGEVIGERRARAFLFSSKSRHVGIDKLFDSRLLHILKKNVSSHDLPGERFDVFKIDYGCYVDLINTTRAPEGLFADDEGTFAEVPKDDYRSIRRAILNTDSIGQ